MIGLSGSLGTFASASGVSVHTNERNLAPSVSSWSRSNGADVNGDGTIRLQDRDDASASTDVAVSSSRSGDYALLVSFTRATGSGRNSDSIAGKPYLYGYLMDGRDILEYLQDDSMTHREGGDWGVSYGVFRIPSGTDNIRYFLNQGSRRGTSDAGREAWFYRPGLFITDSRSDAMDIVDAYERRLDDVEDALDGRSSNDDRYDNPNYGNGNCPNGYCDDGLTGPPVYSTGTLLKCPGRAAVFSVTGRRSIRLFPNEDTFYAWGYSFQDVRTISCATLDRFDMDGSWTYSRDSRLIKFTDSPAVYTLDNGRYLRGIPNEHTARAMYGSDWASRIRLLSPYERYNYVISHQHPNRY